MMTTNNKPPVSFWIICVLALIWNITELYVSNYQMNVMEQQTTAKEFEVLNSLPFWYVIFFVIAILSETAGIFLLFLRKKIAIYLFAISLIALFLIELYWLFVVDFSDFSLLLSVIIPALVIGVALFLYLYSRYASKKLWLK